jgi:hypothetical protein
MGSFVFAEYDNSSNQILDPNELSYSKPYILAQSAVPVMIAQSGNVQGNGFVLPGPPTSMTVNLSATSGSVTVTLGSSLFTGTSADVGKQLTFFDSASSAWRSSLITAAGTTTSCTATLSSTFSSISPGSIITGLGNPLPTAYTGGIWVYLPAGAVSGGAAGFYWCVATQTATANGILQVTTAYQSSMGIPKIPTGFSNAVGGSNFAGVQTDTVLASVVVPGGSMGANGALRIKRQYADSPSATIKVMKAFFGGTDLTFSSQTTTGAAYNDLRDVRNRGLTNAQISTGAWVSIGFDTGKMVYTSVDTTLSQVIELRGQNFGAATDFIVLEGFTVELLPSP